MMNCNCGDADLTVMQESALRTEENVAVRLERIVYDAYFLPRTPEGVQQAKKIRASIRKEFEQLEANRKAAKRNVLEPYERAEKLYNCAVRDPYEKADEELKVFIQLNEDDQKQQCEDMLRRYFEECCDNYGINFLKFEDCGVPVSMATVQKKNHGAELDKIFDFVSMIAMNVETIKTMDFADEIFVEFQTSLSISSAIRAVRDRHRKQQEAAAFLFAGAGCSQDQQNRAAILEAAPDIEEQCTVEFRASGTLEALRAMKAYGVAQGIVFESM